MGTGKRREAKPEINPTGVDIDGTPPWYLLQWAHTETNRFNSKRLCSHLYLYSNLAKYGPDYEICIKYNFKTDNTQDVKARIIQRPPLS